jgi:general secretion pathway protein E
VAHLVRSGALADGRACEAGLVARRRDGRGEVDWLGLTRLAPTRFVEELAAFYGCGRVERRELLSLPFAGERLSPRFLRETRCFPYEDVAGALRLAVAAPIEAESLRAIELALERPIVLVAATPEDLDAALATTLDRHEPGVAAASDGGATEDNLDELRDLAGGAPVVRAVDEFLRLAAEQRATDLHIEPFAGALQVRLRVDGILKAIPAPPMSMAKGILSRLKIIAALNITERRIPQDGRARVVVNGAEIDLRVATMPTMHGESAVVRLLRKGSGAAAMDELGLSQRGEQTLRAALKAPFGMIIVTGPTGSGKTTTLAAALAEMNEGTRKVLTIEDPIEYEIPGINQTQVHPAIGLTFASALRSFLRHDPDVIMVGEMRDKETAQIGVHAALTGHLVLTTLHTNTAAGAIPRLIDMGVESFLLASSLRAVVGQRLVRILCEHCKEPHELSAADFAKDERYAALGFAPGEVLQQPKGCDWCSFSGFRGRKGVFEVLEVSEDVRRAIGPHTETAALEEVAREAGMTTMTQDGVAKCRAGLTTVDEVFRVTASL